MTFQPFEPSYSNHIGAAFHPVTGTAYMLVVWRLNGTGPFSLQVWEQPAPYTDKPTLKRSWKQGIDTNGPFGYGSLLCLPDGSLHISIPVGKTSNQIEPSTLVVPDMCPPFPLGTGGTPGKDGEPGPPGPPGGVGPPGSGGIVLLTAPRTSPAWEGRMLTGGELVDVPATFGVPVASAYLIRFVASAPRADVRVRAGTRDAPFFVTLNTKIANIQEHTTGWVPGASVWVSVVDSSGRATTGQVWFQVCAYST
jgi:hypothetical protein